MSYFFIVNPNAGKGRLDVRARIARFFAGRNIRFEVEYTDARGHASELSC